MQLSRLIGQYSSLASFPLAVEDLEALEETLAIMRDAGTLRRLAESDAELARGEEVTADEITEVLRNRQAQE